MLLYDGANEIMVMESALQLHREVLPPYKLYNFLNSGQMGGRGNLNWVDFNIIKERVNGHS